MTTVQHMIPCRLSIIAGVCATVFALQSTPVAAAPLLLTDEALLGTRQDGSPLQIKINEGLAALDRRDLGGAEAAFRAAAELDAKQAGPYIGLAEVAAQRKELAVADKWMARALSVSPNDVSALRAWGGMLLQRGKFAEAEAAFKKAVAAAPQSAGAHMQLGETYLIGLKQPKAAEASYQAALAARPGSLDAQLGLAASMAAQGRVEDTVAAFEQAAKLAPQDPRPLHSLARFYASQLKFDQALATLDRTLAIAPAHGAALLDRGDLLLASNQPEKAIVAFEAAAKATRQPAPARFRQGVTLEMLQRWDDADRAYSDAIKGEPRMFAAYNNLAFMNASRKVKLDEALAYSKKAIELAPNDPRLQDTLGWVHLARGELDPAAKAIVKAVTAYPEVANFQYHLGIVYDAQGRSKEAAAALRKALELDKNLRGAADARERLKKLASK